MTKKQEMQLLVVATALCFFFAGDRLYRFQYEHMPVAAEGECIRVPMVTGMSDYLDFEVINNDSQVGYSTIRLKSSILSEEVSYAQLKDMGAKKVGCE